MTGASHDGYSGTQIPRIGSSGSGAPLENTTSNVAGRQRGQFPHSLYWSRLETRSEYWSTSHARKPLCESRIVYRRNTRSSSLVGREIVGVRRKQISGRKCQCCASCVAAYASQVLASDGSCLPLSRVFLRSSRCCRSTSMVATNDAQFGR